MACSPSTFYDQLTFSRRALLAHCLLLALSIPARAQEAPGDSLQLTLPPMAYACPGIEISVYFDNVVLTETPTRYRYEVACDLGNQEDTRWTVTPTDAQVGDHAWKIQVFDGAKQLGQREMTLRVVPRNAAAGKELRLLIVGDSLTHATQYPNELARLCSIPGNPSLTLLGTHRPSSAAPGVAHEGYGGWTWERFVSHYVAEDSAQQPSSPFVFLVDGKPQLDVPRYIREACAGQPPHVVTFLLGINDCFAANPEDPAAIDARIDAVFAQAEVLLAAFRAAAPECRLGICLVPPPNARESGFEANYAGRYHRWGWKRIQHRLVQRQLERFGGRQAEHIHLIPTQLNIDPIDGYPIDNGVHPNAAGYHQIAASIYCWLKE